MMTFGKANQHTQSLAVSCFCDSKSLYFVLLDVCITIDDGFVRLSARIYLIVHLNGNDVVNLLTNETMAVAFISQACNPPKG